MASGNSDASESRPGTPEGARSRPGAARREARHGPGNGLAPRRRPTTASAGSVRDGVAGQLGGAGDGGGDPSAARAAAAAAPEDAGRLGAREAGRVRPAAARGRGTGTAERPRSPRAASSPRAGRKAGGGRPRPTLGPAATRPGRRCPAATATGPDPVRRRDRPPCRPPERSPADPALLGPVGRPGPLGHLARACRCSPPSAAVTGTRRESIAQPGAPHPDLGCKCANRFRPGPTWGTSPRLAEPFRVPRARGAGEPLADPFTRIRWGESGAHPAL